MLIPLINVAINKVPATAKPTGFDKTATNPATILPPTAATLDTPAPNLATNAVINFPPLEPINPVPIDDIPEDNLVTIVPPTDDNLPAPVETAVLNDVIKFVPASLIGANLLIIA